MAFKFYSTYHYVGDTVATFNIGRELNTLSLDDMEETYVLTVTPIKSILYEVLDVVAVEDIQDWSDIKANKSTIEFLIEEDVRCIYAPNFDIMVGGITKVFYAAGKERRALLDRLGLKHVGPNISKELSLHHLKMYDCHPVIYQKWDALKDKLDILDKEAYYEWLVSQYGS